MQRGGGHIATDPNPRLATKDLDVSRFKGCRLRLYLAGRRRCCDRKKQGSFGWLATAALHTELTCSVLPPPLEQHVGVEPITQRQLRHGYFRFAGFDGQSAFEFLRVIGPARTTPRNNFTSIQNGPRYFIWRTPLSLTVTLFARRPQNDAYCGDDSVGLKVRPSSQNSLPMSGKRTSFFGVLGTPVRRARCFIKSWTCCQRSRSTIGVCFP